MMNSVCCPPLFLVQGLPLSGQSWPPTVSMEAPESARALLRCFVFCFDLCDANVLTPPTVAIEPRFAIRSDPIEPASRELPLLWDSPVRAPRLVRRRLAAPAQAPPRSMRRSRRRCRCRGTQMFALGSNRPIVLESLFTCLATRAPR